MTPANASGPASGSAADPEESSGSCRAGEVFDAPPGPATGSATGSAHPGFDPYRGLRDELLCLPPQAWIARCNRLAGARGLRSAGGAPLRFVAATDAQDALGYEAAILHEGRVACRVEGRGAIHDLHNALVWLAFPAVKSTLNRLHVDAAHAHQRGRGRVRDVATLLDESGLLWWSGDRRLDAQLESRNWRALLVDNRARVAARVRPIVIGHGLLEKLAAPYKAMTAHCLVCNRDASVADDALDTSAAVRLAAAFAAGGVPKLAPLPILGLPGWDPGNVDPSYYDDARVFRA